MLEGLISADTFFGVNVHEFSDQILCFWPQPFILRDLRIAIGIVLVEDFEGVYSDWLVWEDPAEEDKEDDAAGPHVALGVIEEFKHYFWGHVNCLKYKILGLN